MTALVLRADANRLPLPDESVDLIVTSPPYFGQRSYRDGGEHYHGQVGSEPTPAEFLEALWAVTVECWRVLKPTGSMWVNLGDKRSGSGAPGTTSGLSGRRSNGTAIPGQAKVQGERSGLATYNRAAFGRAKSKQLLPHRYAIGCEDGTAGPCGVDHAHVPGLVGWGLTPLWTATRCDRARWIVRQDQVWAKVNGLPEPFDDRTHDRHEYVFHLTKQGAYYGCVDPIREPHSTNSHPRRKDGDVAPKDRTGAEGVRGAGGYFGETTFHPLGRAPGSVWTIANEPLTVPDSIDIEHFAAYPTELPRRIIAGWSPSGICTACGTARRPVVDVDRVADRRGRKQRIVPHGTDAVHGYDGRGGERWKQTVVITGEACACPEPTAPTRPAVVLDPFGGTGTTALAAHALGRTGISIDLSHDYCRLAQWRTGNPDQAAKVRRRTNEAAQLGLTFDTPPDVIDTPPIDVFDQLRRGHHVDTGATA